MKNSVFNNDRVRLMVTDTCNFDCFYCHNEGQISPSGSFINLDFIESFVSFVKRNEIYIRSLTITGGEPLLHRDIVSIVDLLRPITEKISIVTNGSLLNDKLLEGLREAGLDYIKVGVDTLDGRPSKPCMKRKCPTGEEILEKILLAREYIPYVKLNIVACRYAMAKLKETLSKAFELGLDVKILELINIHNARIDFDETGPTPSEILNLLKSWGFITHIMYDSYLGKWYCSTKYGTKIEICENFCKRGICKNLWTRIDSRGYLIPCIHSEKSFKMSFNKDGISIILKNNDMMRCSFFNSSSSNPKNIKMGGL